jgi:ABC-type nitrate/sulfonate/bicarbonate transport system permease component
MMRVLDWELCKFRVRNDPGFPLGVLMGRYKGIENFVLPLASALMPIPSLAVFAPLEAFTVVRWGMMT